MLRRSCFRQLPQILPAYSLKQCRRCQFHALATPLFKYDSSNDNGNSNKMKPSDTNRNSKQNSMEEDLEASSSNSDMGVDDITTLRSDKQQITPRRRDSSNWSRKPPYQQHYSNSQKIETADSISTNFKSYHNKVRLPSPKELKHYLDQYSIGQDKAKKHFSVAIYNHCIRLRDRQDREEKELEALDFEFDNGISKSFREVIQEQDDQVLLEKSNVLLLGPTGSGKTLLAKVLAKALDVPFTISDCTSMTQAGYIGEDVETCIQRLAQASDFNVDRIESGIVVLDEFDKLSKKQSFDSRRDVSGEGVQQALLKLVEGTKVTINVPPGNSGSLGMNKNDTISIDTSNILFIFMGAFTGLERIIFEKLSKVDRPKVTLKDIFGREIQDPNKQIHSISEGGREIPIFDYTTHEDLISYGIIPELAGRIPVIVSTSQLTISELQKVLTEPRNSILKRYKLLFSKWGSHLEFTEPALYEISRYCFEKGIGARGLTSVIDHLLVEPNYDSPHSGTKYILINEEVVKTMNDKTTARVQPLYFSSYETVSFLDAIELEDPDRAHKLSRELFKFQFGADQKTPNETTAKEKSNKTRKVAASG